MGLMDGKKVLITGVLTDASLAFEVAKLAQLEGAEVVLTASTLAVETRNFKSANRKYRG